MGRCRRSAALAALSVYDLAVRPSTGPRIPLEHPAMSGDEDDDFILWFAAAIAVIVAVIIASIVGVAVAIS